MFMTAFPHKLQTKSRLILNNSFKPQIKKCSIQRWMEGRKIKVKDLNANKRENTFYSQRSFLNDNKLCLMFLSEQDSFDQCQKSFIRDVFCPALSRLQSDQVSPASFYIRRSRFDSLKHSCFLQRSKVRLRTSEELQWSD